MPLYVQWMVNATRLADALAAARLLGLEVSFVQLSRRPAPRVELLIRAGQWEPISAEGRALLRYFEED